jgi:uncharacterized protein (TIGR02147 family)
MSSKKWGNHLPHLWDRLVAARSILHYAAFVKTALTANLRTSPAIYDISAILRERLRAAMRRNPRFSLRAFAKQLGIDHSTLSQVLRRKRRLSSRDLQAVGSRLGLSEEAIEAYAQGSGKKSNRNKASEEILSFHLDLDTFQLLSVWYHYAILELLQVQGFKTDSRWIAATLGIAVEDVNIALQRLLRLGLLEMSGRDRWTDKSGDAEFHSSALTEAARNQMNQDVHELAADAIRRVASEHRVHRQMVVAVDSNSLPRLQRLADEFTDELRSLISESASKDDVYQVEISLFPVTTLKKIRGDKNA